LGILQFLGAFLGLIEFATILEKIVLGVIRVDKHNVVAARGVGFWKGRFHFRKLRYLRMENRRRIKQLRWLRSYFQDFSFGVAFCSCLEKRRNLLQLLLS